jgi:2-polyprenyl-3-methyl-5-hydroxy-6-metoxy-1,4-benzoquinol methylase
VPTVIKEAAAVGTPVVATRVVGIPELVVEGESGLLVEAGDALALAGAIAQVLADPALGARLAAAGRAHAERLFDLQENAERLATLIRDLAAGGGCSLNAGRKRMDNAVRQAEFYDVKWSEAYLFRDISFAEHLQSIHWHLLFHRHLKNVADLRILDIGCGTGWTSLLLAQRGARVTAIDISPRQIEILRRNALHYGLDGQIQALAGDITRMELPAASFDLSIGASFLHHLEHPEERAILGEIARLLVPGGTAFFMEPAVNSRFLDRLRYLIPVPGRPASWSRAWAEYKRRDPHPERDISSAHFRRLGQALFAEADVEAMGIFNRLERLTRYRAKSFIHKSDYIITRLLPRPLREPFCRAQIIRYRKADRG